jgi:hypothetical protein
MCFIVILLKENILLFTDNLSFSEFNNHCIPEVKNEFVTISNHDLSGTTLFD